MSSKGECWDHGVVESCFSALNRELFEDTIVENRTLARQAIFEDIEAFSHRHRRYSILGD